MNLEKRIEALEKHTMTFSEWRNVVLAIWNPKEGTEEQAIERALSEKGIARLEAGRIIVVRLVQSPHSEPQANTETVRSFPSSNVVDIKSANPVKDRPLPLPNVGIV